MIKGSYFHYDKDEDGRDTTSGEWYSTDYKLRVPSVTLVSGLEEENGRNDSYIGVKQNFIFSFTIL